MKQFITEAKRFQKLAGIIKEETQQLSAAEQQYSNAEAVIEVEFAPEFVDQSTDTENTWTNPDTGEKYMYKDVLFYGEVDMGEEDFGQEYVEASWWDTEKYTDIENKAIEQWFDKNRDEVEKALIKANLNGAGSPV